MTIRRAYPPEEIVTVSADDAVLEGKMSTGVVEPVEGDGLSHLWHADQHDHAKHDQGEADLDEADAGTASPRSALGGSAERVTIGHRR